MFDLKENKCFSPMTANTITSILQKSKKNYDSIEGEKIPIMNTVSIIKESFSPSFEICTHCGCATIRKSLNLLFSSIWTERIRTHFILVTLQAVCSFIVREKNAPFLKWNSHCCKKKNLANLTIEQNLRF